MNEVKVKIVGFNWLKENLKLKAYFLTNQSFIGATNKLEVGLNNVIVRTFTTKYEVNSPNILDHLEFGLKYDDLNLAFVCEVFKKVNHKTVVDFVAKNANKKYNRIIGFLYEFLIGKPINIKITTSNYQNLLDDSKYFTGETVKNTKWKINNNLLGTEKFCPIIRKTTELTTLLNWNIEEAISKLKHQYSPEIFKRASYYLYKKETKSSSAIEKEEPSEDRIEKFIALLEKAGQQDFEETLTEKELVKLQNAIVDARYTDKGFRDFQNYIGQTMRDFSQKIHYVCPPPQFVKKLMEGLTALNGKNKTTETILKATMVSFGFVYIHPFEDGNGRIHRFLIHDILVRDGVVPNSTILPVSAQILANMQEYDSILEILSKNIARKVKYKIDDNGEMKVKNANEIEAIYKFVDLTEHALFLAKAIKITVTKDIPEELHFLKCYDDLKKEIKSIVDMPENKIDKLITFLHQNKGKLASRKRKFFKELANTEIEEMELSYSEVFEVGENKIKGLLN